MNVAVIGTGYVGLVTGACLADTGATVTCVDIDTEKVERLCRGEIPIFEPGLDELVMRNVAKGRLRFTTNLTEALRDAQVAFIAVGTPPGNDGSADLSQVLGVARSIGMALVHHATDYLVVVTKSTVPVGTAQKVWAEVNQVLAPFPDAPTFDVASNPEFLKEGAAIDDFARPDRIVIGVESERAKGVLERLYRPFLLNSHPVLFMDVASAEITKYAANAMLAMRISFMNTIAALCDVVGANVDHVRRGIGSDPRIGPGFLYAGAGYGGSCFPKDVRALAETSRSLGIDFALLDEVERINERQKFVVIAKAMELLGRSESSGLDGFHFAIWGIAFKPNTDDSREAPAIAVIEKLLRLGATVSAYDPIARLPDGLKGQVIVCTDPYDAVDQADVLILVTEWSEFRNADIKKLAARMKQRNIVDGRNVLDSTELTASNFSFSRIGSPARKVNI
jgi:UDPglucose 6-dehydrogenase